MDYSLLARHFWAGLVFLSTRSTLAVPFWAAVLWLILLLIRRPLFRIIFHYFGVDDESLQKAITAQIDVPVQLFLVLVAITPFVRAIPGKTGDDIEKTATFLCAFLLIHVFIQSLYFLVVRWYLAGVKNVQIPGVVQSVLMVLGYSLVILVLLNWNYQLNVLPLLATSTVLTAIAALALQDTLRNIFAGLTVTLEQSFRQGDWVLFRQDSANTLVGQVVEIGWRSTKIRTANNNYVIIPNSQFTSNELINYNSPTPIHARELKFPVNVRSDPTTIGQEIEKAAAKIEGVLPEPKPAAVPVEMQATQVVYQLRFWLENFETREAVSGAVIEAVWQTLARLNAMPGSTS